VRAFCIYCTFCIGWLAGLAIPVLHSIGPREKGTFAIRIFHRRCDRELVVSISAVAGVDITTCMH
jgi:hypothetical protein